MHLKLREMLSARKSELGLSAHDIEVRPRVCQRCAAKRSSTARETQIEGVMNKPFQNAQPTSALSKFEGLALEEAIDLLKAYMF